MCTAQTDCISHLKMWCTVSYVKVAAGGATKIFTTVCKLVGEAGQGVSNISKTKVLCGILAVLSTEK